MPIPLRVRNKQHIVVPVRFGRAVTGAAQTDAPDVDDRGFAMGSRPAKWGKSTARGAMVGVTVGDSVRLKILAEDIDSSAPLFVTSSNSKIVDVVDPPNGGPLTNDGVFVLRGIADLIQQPVFIKVHLGGLDGPVIGELEPHVFTLVTLRVRAHMVEIDGALNPGEQREPLKRKEQDLPALFKFVNDIWRPAGIEFKVLDPILRQSITLSRQARVMRAVVQKVNKNPKKPPEIISRDSAEAFKIIKDLANREKIPVINVFFVRQFQDRVKTLDPDVPDIDVEQEQNSNIAGEGISKKASAGRGHGLLLADEDKGGDGITLAHEFGHYLGLEDHADELPAPADGRLDMWSCRRLMFSSLPPTAPPFPPFRNDTGYGANRRGALITLKDLKADPNDGETARARKTAVEDPY
jgi:hypothetical protein